MKKIFILLFISLLLCGCEKTEEMIPKESKEEIKESVIDNTDKYIDLNNTPIGIYALNGNTLNRLSSINKQLNVEEDIGIFQVYPSNDDMVILNDNFANSFYNEWIKYNPNNNIKIGFNIKFSLISGEKVSYNMLSPSNTFDKWEYLMNYFYDDYANRFKGHYSHIEDYEYNDNTLFTAIKLQSSYQCNEINSAIKLTVFTYDSEDDFIDNEYRGNSKYTFTICVNGNCN